MPDSMAQRNKMLYGIPKQPEEGIVNRKTREKNEALNDLYNWQSNTKKEADGG